MKAEYWDVTDEQVIEKTGKPLAHWKKGLTKFGAATKTSTELVEHLQKGARRAQVSGSDVDDEGNE
jgi:hypothetical protein